jgi:hypothetical protein
MKSVAVCLSNERGKRQYFGQNIEDVSKYCAFEKESSITWTKYCFQGNIARTVLIRPTFSVVISMFSSKKCSKNQILKTTIF